MGNAPGNTRGALAQCATAHGQCHRKQTAGGAKHGGIEQGNLRDVFEKLVPQVRVKRWGKSPPLAGFQGLYLQTLSS